MNDVHRQQTLAALAELAALNPGQPVPQGLDDRFAAFAAGRRAARRAEQWVFYPVIRGAAVWANPFASMGWPVEIDAEARAKMVERLSTEPIKSLGEMIADQPGPTVVKGAVSGWRYVTVVAIFLILVLSFRRGADLLLVFTWLAIAYAVLRTAVLGELCKLKHV